MYVLEELAAEKLLIVLEDEEVLEDLAAKELLVVLEDEEHLLKNEFSEELSFFNNISVEHCTAEFWG